MERRTRVPNGEIVLAITRGKDDGIERKRSSDEHANDIKARSGERGFLFPLGSRPQHHGQAGEYDNGHENSNSMRMVIRHDLGPNKARGYQRNARKEELQRP